VYSAILLMVLMVGARTGVFNTCGAIERRASSAGVKIRVASSGHAICLRSRDHPRVVSEDECSRCACWESPTDPVSDVRREHNHGGPRRPTFMA
jgi:hypothetical protein